jgi:GAF domain-containing protein
MKRSVAFAARLSDLLATLESAALVGAATERARGLGEQLRFACLATPCSEALVALEVESLGRLSIPVVANADTYRTVDAELFPAGTPFAYLLGGGGGHAVELVAEDPMIAELSPLLSAPPVSAVFLPITLGGAVIGGAGLFSHEARLGERELELGERLAGVLALTVESFRTERALLELFARALPDLLGDDAPTSLATHLARYVHELRVAPGYRARLELALSVGRLVAHGEPEARLARSILDRVEAYAADAGSGQA